MNVVNIELIVSYVGWNEVCDTLNHLLFAIFLKEIGHTVSRLNIVQTANKNWQTLMKVSLAITADNTMTQISRKQNHPQTTF